MSSWSVWTPTAEPCNPPLLHPSPIGNYILQQSVLSQSVWSAQALARLKFTVTKSNFDPFSWSISKWICRHPLRVIAHCDIVRSLNTVSRSSPKKDTYCDEKNNELKLVVLLRMLPTPNLSKSDWKSHLKSRWPFSNGEAVRKIWLRFSLDKETSQLKIRNVITDPFDLSSFFLCVGQSQSLPSIIQRGLLVSRVIFRLMKPRSCAPTWHACTSPRTRKELLRPRPNITRTQSQKHTRCADNNLNSHARLITGALYL